MVELLLGSLKFGRCQEDIGASKWSRDCNNISYAPLFPRRAILWIYLLHFTNLKSFKVEEYLESREWEGKAGGCMVEGFL